MTTEYANAALRLIDHRTQRYADSAQYMNRHVTRKKHDCAAARTLASLYDRVYDALETGAAATLEDVLRVCQDHQQQRGADARAVIADMIATIHAYIGNNEPPLVHRTQQESPME